MRFWRDKISALKGSCAESVPGQLHLEVGQRVIEIVPVHGVEDAIIIMARGVIVAATVVVTRGQRQRAVVVPPTYTHYMVHYCIYKL